MSVRTQRLVAVALLAFVVTIAIWLAFDAAVAMAGDGGVEGCC